jgi:lipopolysaccharide transport system ATP-binding protein
MPTAIKFENISKQYRLGLVSTNTISHDLNRWWQTNIRGKEDPYLKIGDVNDRATKGESDYVWALKDINFEVQQGDVLGIIGKNGAGKSTLLKILSKVTAPSTGTIKAAGRIASLLEVGTGFHPEMTGRENIFMNGAIMGMTKAEINRKLDEIVDFSGVERYIDTPAKRYSSGMTVRLGFAIAAHLEPEILVVDEVLAVGDAEFQKKAIGKMQDVSKGEGRTVLFVSHNMSAIQALCHKVVVLENGSTVFNGTVNEGVDFYLNSNVFTETTIKSGIRYQNSEVVINEITINNKEDNLILLDYNQHSISINIKGELKSSKKMAIELRFFDSKEQVVALFSPSQLHGRLQEFKQGNFEIEEIVTLPSNLTNGEFYFDIDLIHPNLEGYLSIPKHVKLISKGILSYTGVELNYNECGLLIL